MSWRGAAWIAALAPGLAGLHAEFAPPSAAERRDAIGSVAGLDATMREAFTPGKAFAPKKAPRAMDWLAAHKESGQTYGHYTRSGYRRVRGLRRVLYILPLGEFEIGRAPSLEILKAYAAAYYQPLEVRVLPTVPAKEVPATSRKHGPTGKQWKTDELVTWLPKKLPADAYAMLAVTTTDLYPNDRWNFVFGVASLRDRVGVFSFARYHPAVFGEEAGDDTGSLVLRRAAKVLTHEMGHMFGIPHCIYFECNMNGSNHLGEADAAPLHLCPVCLRKMQHVVGFDPVSRYEKLEKFYRDHGLREEAEWVEGRIAAVNGAKDKQ